MHSQTKACVCLWSDTVQTRKKTAEMRHPTATQPRYLCAILLLPPKSGFNLRPNDQAHRRQWPVPMKDNAQPNAATGVRCSALLDRRRHSINLEGKVVESCRFEFFRNILWHIVRLCRASFLETTEGIEAVFRCHKPFNLLLI